MGRRSGLGKGLGALIPATERLEDTDTALRELPVSEIRANAYQPRGHFDEEALVSLAASIQAVGVLQPVLVRQTGPQEYELIAGERRWRAARRAGLQTIPAIVRATEDVRSLEQALVENLHREDLTPLEEAAAYQQLVEQFGHTQEEVAQRVGKSRSAVANTMRLLHLPPSIQRLLAEGQITAGHARALLGTPDRMFQEQLARAVVSEHLTVREVEQRVRAHNGEPEEPDEPAADATSAAAPVAVVRPAALLELEELLSSHLDTRVQVSMGAKRGRVVVDFATLEDLERLYRVIVEGREAAD